MLVRNLKEWHEEVLKRDEYTCQGCSKYYGYEWCFEGDKNLYLTGHHLKTQKAFPELKLETDNGTCLCQKCHNAIHNGNFIL